MLSRSLARAPCSHVQLLDLLLRLAHQRVVVALQVPDVLQEHGRVALVPLQLQALHHVHLLLENEVRLKLLQLLHRVRVRVHLDRERVPHLVEGVGQARLVHEGIERQLLLLLLVGRVRGGDPAASSQLLLVLLPGARANRPRRLGVVVVKVHKVRRVYVLPVTQRVLDLERVQLGDALEQRALGQGGLALLLLLLLLQILVVALVGNHAHLRRRAR